LLLIYSRPSGGGLNRRGVAFWLPRTRQGILDGGDDFGTGHGTPTIRHAVFEQVHNLTGGQMRVQLAGDTEKPVVDAFTGTRRSGQQFLKEWRMFAGHGYFC
jgi:hypothetical protein